MGSNSKFGPGKGVDHSNNITHVPGRYEFKSGPKSKLSHCFEGSMSNIDCDIPNHIRGREDSRDQAPVEREHERISGCIRPNRALKEDFYYIRSCPYHVWKSQLTSHENE